MTEIHQHNYDLTNWPEGRCACGAHFMMARWAYDHYKMASPETHIIVQLRQDA